MKMILLMRAYALHIYGVLLTVVLCGCNSFSVTHEIDGMAETGSLGGVYDIRNVDATIAAALRKHAPQSVIFTEEYDPSAVSLDIYISSCLQEQYSKSSLVIPGIFTLGALPIILETYRDYVVAVKSQIWAREISLKMIERESFSWIPPLGMLPLVFPLDGYDYSVLDMNKKRNDAREDALLEGLTNAVAKVVLSTLTKARYDAYTKKITENARRKNLEDAIAQQENILYLAERGWPQESVLRDFAIKETTGLWDVVVSFRAEITVRKIRLQKLDDALRGFGKKPEEDVDYIKCKGEYNAARSALVQIFKSLENAYLAASKNEALYESVEAHARTRTAVDECSRVALDAANRILNQKGRINEEQ